MLSCGLHLIIAAIVEGRKAIMCVGGVFDRKYSEFVGVNCEGFGEWSVKSGDRISSWNLENGVT